MPILSMTGYGHGESSGARFRATARLRSLNHRNLEIAVVVNDPFTALDRDVRARVEKAFSRGKVDVSLYVEPVADSAFDLRLDAGLVRAWMREVEALRKSLHIEEKVSFLEALRVPGAVQAVPRDGALSDEERGEILGALDAAIKEALAMKRTEGEALARDFAARLDVMTKAVDTVAAQADGMVRVYAEKLAERIKEWSQDGNIKFDEERLLREAAFYAERSDVAEEITRLGSHIAQFRALLVSEEAGAGRTLDFLVQEMHREANTLSAKARFDTVAPLALQLRGDIEKLREQARNIE